MSNETDRLVSDTYNELADEKTPEALNREVLRLAAKEGRTRYSIARGWMRPVAWAATIGLSLVVVLELAILPGTDMSPSPQSVPVDAATQADAAEPQADRIKEEIVLESEAGEERKDSFAKRSRPYSPEEQRAEKVSIQGEPPVASGIARQRVSQTPLLSTDAEPAAEPMAGESVDEDALQDVAPARSVALSVESFASGAASLSAESDYLCPPEARLSAEKWLQCIEELEADSPPERVEREYEEFRKRYPDFEHPAADK